MRSRVEITATRATAIAATNEVVRHLKLGAFLVQIHAFGDHPVSSRMANTVKESNIEGRTNTGVLIKAVVDLAVVPLCSDRDPPMFPFERIVVAIFDFGVRGQKSSEPRYFECRITENDFDVSELSSSPH